MYKNLLAASMLISVCFQALSQEKINARQIENLQAFARIYGYVKYFHPSDEAAFIDWDKFAQFGCMKVLNAKNDDELLHYLRVIFNPIAPSVQIFKKGTKQQFDVSSITPASSKDHSIITWQHYGVGLGNSNIYKSIRINRPGTQKMNTQRFASINQVLDAKVYAGKKVKLKAWMKVVQGENDGKGQLWLRVDKEKGMGFFYNMDENPAISTEWRQYEFDATIDSDGKNLYFGAFLSGKGKLFIDQIELLVQEGNVWKPAAIKNGSFEELANNIPSGWNGIGNNASYEFAANSAEVKNGAYSLMIASKDSPANQQPVKFNKPIFNPHPTPGEIFQKNITPTIEVIVPLALFGDSSSTFPRAEQSKLDSLKQSIQSSTKDKTDGSHLGVRLAAIVVSWNIFKHFFPYWEDAAQGPNEILKLAMARAFQDRTSRDFLKTLRLMTAPLNDGHIWVSVKGNTAANYSLPLLVDIVGKSLVIDKVLDPSLTHKLKPGDIITTIDSLTSEQLVNNKLNEISGSTQWKVARARFELFFGPENAGATLKINRNGKVELHELKRNFKSSNLYIERDKRRKSGFVKPGIHYIDLNILPFDSIKNHLGDLQAAKAIICDLRGYPKNNHQLIMHLLRSKEDTRWMFVPQVIYPDYEKVSYASLGWNLAPAKEQLAAKIIFITDGSAISYAESFMGFIKDFKLATIIGQPTAGTNGNVNPMNLPGGYTISWTGMLVKNHDGSKHHLKGIVPDIYLTRTIKGISEGRDEFLEKAIELSEK